MVPPQPQSPFGSARYASVWSLSSPKRQLIFAGRMCIELLPGWALFLLYVRTLLTPPSSSHRKWLLTQCVRSRELPDLASWACTFTVYGVALLYCLKNTPDWVALRGLRHC
jgi:hypothetical protein